MKTMVITAVLVAAALGLTGCAQSMDSLHDQKYKECFQKSWDRWEKKNDNRMTDEEAEKWITKGCEEIADKAVTEEMKK